MIKCILYARFSPRSNADTCPSADRQIADMREYCERKRWVVAGEFRDEAMSGDDEKRPGVDEAIEALGRGYILLVYDFSRLARSQIMLETYCSLLINRRARLVSMTQGPADETDEQVLTRQFLGAMDEYQLKKIRKRTSRRMRQHQSNGRLMSNITPYGWRYGPDKTIIDAKGKETIQRTLEEDPDEQLALTEMLSWWDGGIGLREICRRLTAAGHKSRQDSWYPTTVKRIINRELEKLGVSGASGSA